jgi:pimeloyl-ACP methyl ester carboxylesterase
MAMGMVQRYALMPGSMVIPYIEKGNSTGKTLVLVHGIADSYVAFEPLFPYLSESYRTLAVTLRGHGDATRPESGYKTKDFTEDLLMFLDHLRIEKAVLLGASSGGFPARCFAATYPERVEGLILLGSPSSLGDKPGIRKEWDEVFSKLEDPVDENFVRGFSQSLAADQVPKTFLELMLNENLKVPANVWKETFEGLMEERFPGELEKIKTDTLILWGDQDVILSRRDQEELHKAIQNSRFKMLSGLGHLLYWEAPQRVAEEINIFMKSVGSGSDS